MATLDPYEFPCDFDLWGVPHFANLVSNLPFALLGAWGLARARALGAATGRALGAWPWIWASVVAIGLGSAAYHLRLTPLTLALDRIAICAFAGLFLYHALLMARLVSPSLLTAAACVLAFEATVVAWGLGLTSIVYGAVQAVGGASVLLLYVRRVRPRRPEIPLSPLVCFYALYAAAKLVEAADRAICDATGVLGGHPLKHLLAAAGLACLLPLMRREYAAAAPSRSE